MRRIAWISALFLGVFLHNSARAETSLDILAKELAQAKQDHQDATSQLFSNFISELDKAAASPDAAITLYEEAGGDPPDPAPVLAKIPGDESPNEKTDRQNVDQANASALAYVVQLHCGLMRYAAFFVQAPDREGLHDAWISWLKSASQVYPHVGKTPDDPRIVPPAAQPKAGAAGGAKRRKALPPDLARDLKEKAMRDSIIPPYLGFTSWGDKDPGAWRVKDIPKLYRQEILEPLRKTPSAATLAAWDTYIAMKSADQPDRDKWAQSEYPGLIFDKDCDDYAISPSTDKLATLVQLIKDNPTYPNLDDWFSRVQQLMNPQSAAATPPPTTPATPPTTAATTTTNSLSQAPVPDPLPAKPAVVDPTAPATPAPTAGTPPASTNAPPPNPLIPGSAPLPTTN